MDGTTSGTEIITLVIKTPNQAHGDQLIQDVNINWTVKDLKTHLATVYPTKPAEKDQRLIFSGKLLLDHQHLKDVLKTMDGIPALHLVLAFKPHCVSQLGARPKVRPAEQQQQPSRIMPTEPSVPTVPSSTGLRQRGHPVPAEPTTMFPATGTGTSTFIPRAAAAAMMNQPNFPNYSLYSPQQLMWLQHMYARQYYMQYQAAMAAAASAPITTPIAAQQPAVTPALPNQAPIDNLPANQNPPDPAFINPEGANQNLRMNAQGGAVMEDEEDVERDWLDWVYTASRAAVFLSIVYFYSNMTRFVLVMSSLLLMYLHTAGWFPFRHRAQAQPPNQPAPEVLQNQQNQNQDRQEEVEPPAGTEDGEVDGEAGEQPNTSAVPLSPVRPSVLWTAWVFFKAFFASLIPEAPRAMAN